MFVKNDTKYQPVLARADVTDDLSVGTIVVRAEYRALPTGLVGWGAPRPQLDTDAPTTAEVAIWEGTSVTVAGTVRGPGRLPHMARVDVHVGADSRSVLVLGDRQWVRNAGKLVPSTPAPFDTKPLSWDLAFGGAYELPPGLDPIRKLPHPGGQIAYPLNPTGVGFYRDDQAAEGQALPSIEQRDHRIERREDQPRPAGFAPCPALVGLRAPASAPADPNDPEWHFRTMLRAVHPAPSEMIFADLSPATTVRVAGVGSSPIAFEIPRSPVRVAKVRDKSREAVGFRVRTVHVSAVDGAVIIEYAHAFGFGPGAAPSWIVVSAA